MFTGLIEEIGVIKNVKKFNLSSRIEVKCSKVLCDTKLGDSISTNGVCLTVVKLSSDTFVADVMAETMKRSNLSLLKPNDKVNLERAMKLGSRLGGHIVSGHIDGTGKIISKMTLDNSTLIDVKVGEHILKYLIEKGSVSIDGISLTIVDVYTDYFRVSIIPLTSKDTGLISKSVGECVNLEVDMLSKYVEKLLGIKKAKSKIDMDFLSENGFL